MRTLFLALIMTLALAVGASAQDSEFKLIGAFDNIWSNGEHQNGFMLSLWKTDVGLVGYMFGSFGSRLVGDPPCGLIDEVVYNAKSGKLSFSSDFGRFGHQFRFSGTLTKKTVRGVLSEFSGTTLWKKKRIVFRRSRDWTELMSSVYESEKELREKKGKRCGP